MSKRGEIDYFRACGSEHSTYALHKPFSDQRCGSLLLDMGWLHSLLPSPPARILDLGVGSGWTSTMLAQRGFDVVGQDIAQDAIDLATQNKRRHGLENLHFIVSDYEGMRFHGEFDCAVFYDCLHHAEDEFAALSAVYRALKPGGICITFEPGAGHAKNPESIEAMRRFGVTERDMPPSLIIRSGKRAGFSSYDVFERITDPRLVASSDPLWLFKRGSWLRRLVKSLDPSQRLKRLRRAQNRPSLSDSLELPNIVVLRK